MSAAARALVRARASSATAASAVPATRAAFASAASSKPAQQPAPVAWEDIAVQASTPVLSPPTPSDWKRPIPSGIEPAYDEALNYLAKRKQELLAQQGETEQQAVLAATQNDTDKASDLVAQAEALAIAAEVDDPAVRWAFGKGWQDMTRPAVRYMREQAWRRQTYLSTGNRKPVARSHQELGPLNTLQFRAQVMKVIPDLVPFAVPTADLQLFYGVGHGFGDHGGQAGDVHPGCLVPAHKTCGVPHVEATVFHPEERKYSLVMVDLDAPDEQHATYQQWLHWLIEDIPLSATQTRIDQAEINAAEGAKGRVILPYVPPHPAQGSSKHRYVTVLMTTLKAPTDGLSKERVYHEQVSSSAYPLSPVDLDLAKAKANEPPTERGRFSLREYLAHRGLDIAGLHFFREQWDEGEPAKAVSQVHQDLGIPEAVYEPTVHYNLPDSFKPPKA